MAVANIDIEAQDEKVLSNAFSALCQDFIEQRSQANTMQVFVRTIRGNTITIFVKPTDNIESVKLLIQHKIRIPCNLQRLIFGGLELYDDRTIADYHIEKEATLHLNARLGGGNPSPTSRNVGHKRRNLNNYGTFNFSDCNADLDEDLDRIKDDKPHTGADYCPTFKWSLPLQAKRNIWKAETQKTCG